MHSEFNLEEVFRVISISIASCRVSNGKESFDIPIKLFHKIGEPIVGDWLSVCRENFSFTKIKILQRTSKIERKENNPTSRKISTTTQAIVANVDIAFIVQSVGNDFNIGRIYRYLTSIDTNIEPCIIINKIDKDENWKKYKDILNNEFSQIPVVGVSTVTKEGLDVLVKGLIGLTAVFIGSSGVGKTSIINLLSRQNHKVNETSEKTGKGKHTSSSRELFIIPTGGCVIDTPGMRAFGISAGTHSLELVFSDIERLAKRCKYKNCTHIQESHCAVNNAIQRGAISQLQLNQYHKLKGEVINREARKKDLAKRVKAYLKHSQPLTHY